MYPEILDQLPGAMLGERAVRTPITGRSGGSRKAGCLFIRFLMETGDSPPFTRSSWCWVSAILDDETFDDWLADLQVLLLESFKLELLEHRGLTRD